MANRINVTIPAATVTVVGGGDATPAAVYENGQATGQVVQRDGKPVKRLRGATAFIDGQPAEGLTVETISDFDSLPAGSILRGEGQASLSIRADARPGFGGGSPRGEIAGTVFVQNLVAVASIDSLLTTVDTRRGRGE